MRVTSTSYAEGGDIPVRHAMHGIPGGEDVSVPLSWTGAPPGTRSFVISMIDRHPVAHGWVHWLVVDVPGGVSTLGEGVSCTAAMPAGACELDSGYGRPGYGGPRPPRGSGAHDYVTTVYALDIARLGVDRSSGWPEVSGAMVGHTLASGTLVGRFSA
jgi:Raf kinase inhibitor-like YbhB/YbcL family protein